MKNYKITKLKLIFIIIIAGLVFIFVSIGHFFPSLLYCRGTKVYQGP